MSNFHRRWGFLLVGSYLSVAACQGSPPANVPVSTVSPSPSSSSPLPSSSSPPAPAIQASPLQLFNVAPGAQVAYDAPVAHNLSLIVSAATLSPDQPSFQLSENLASNASPLALLTAPFMPVAQAGSPPRQISQTAPARVTGSQDTFWINPGGFDDASDKQVPCVLRRVTPNAYFYVDPAAANVTDAELDALSGTFESTIYPRVTGVFGAEARPGVDGDNHLFIVISPAVGTTGTGDDLGYFWARDAVPAPASDPHSNGKEVFFISSALFGHATILEYGVVAHELQHLINFSDKGPRLNYKNKEDAWLDEGMSMVAMDVAGFGIPQGERNGDQNVADFERNPSAYSLSDFTGNPNGESFGMSYLFVRYLLDRYGASAMRAIIASNLTGVACVDQVLQTHNDGFAHFFNAWTVANVITGQPIAAGTIYNYSSLNLTGNYGTIQLPGLQTTPLSGSHASPTLRPWGSVYLGLSPGASFRLSAGAKTPLACAAISQ